MRCAGALVGLTLLVALGPACAARRDCPSRDVWDSFPTADLDAPPHPVGEPRIVFPNSLRRQPLSGRVVLSLRISEDGRVLYSEVAESDLPPEFGWFLAGAVYSFRFTPPTVRGGCPVEARIKLPIPVSIVSE
jgi:TonB family protein